MMPQPSQPSYPYGSGSHYGYSPSHYGQQAPLPHAHPTPAFMHQPAGYGGSPQGFPQQPMASHSPTSRTHHANKSKSGSGSNSKTTTLAAPPGLPEKPSPAPNYSKEQMMKFHNGSGVSKAAPAGPDPAASASEGPTSTKAIQNTSNTGQDSGVNKEITADNIRRGIDDLLAPDDSVSGGGASQLQYPVSKTTASSVTPSCAEKKAAAAGK